MQGRQQVGAVDTVPLNALVILEERLDGMDQSRRVYACVEAGFAAGVSTTVDNGAAMNQCAVGEEGCCQTNQRTLPCRRLAGNLAMHGGAEHYYGHRHGAPLLRVSTANLWSFRPEKGARRDPTYGYNEVSTANLLSSRPKRRDPTRTRDAALYFGRRQFTPLVNENRDRALPL